MSRPNKRPRSDSNERLRSEIQSLKMEAKTAAKRQKVLETELGLLKREAVDREVRHEERLYRLLQIRFGDTDSDEKDKSEDGSSRARISFPQELFDQFIDNLRSNAKALQACALVCRAWVRRSRYHLFKKIYIHPPPRERNRADHFAQLLGFLDHPFCTFALSVRELYMTGRAYYGMDKPKLGWFSPLIAQLHILVSVNTLLFNLDCDTIPCCQAVILKAPSFAANITRLVLAVDDLVPAENMEWMEMIHLLKSLVEIELNDSEIDEAAYYWSGEIVDLPSVEVLPPKNLRILRMLSSERQGLMPFFQAMIQWLHHNQTRLSTVEFRSLTIDSDDEEPNNAPLQPFFQYLRFLKPSLEVLTLEFSYTIDINRFLDDVLDTRLRTLELVCPTTSFTASEKEPEVFDDSFQSMFILDLSARTPNPFLNLRTLIFELRTPYSLLRHSTCTLRLRKHRPDHDTPCAALDKFLSGPSFPALTVLAFRLSGVYIQIFGWKEYIESTFPLCWQKGLLQTGIYKD